MPTPPPPPPQAACQAPRSPSALPPPLGSGVVETAGVVAGWSSIETEDVAAGADDAGWSSTTGSDAAEVWRAAELVK
eukprot:503582-Hanusia_phi.AAC.1